MKPTHTKENEDDDIQLRIGLARRLDTLLSARRYPSNSTERRKRLATELEMSPAQLRKFLDTHIVPPILLMKLARLLNTSTDYLLGLTDCLDGSVLPSDDNALIAWLWHPWNGMMEQFDIPFPDRIGTNRNLRGLWAIKQTVTLGHRSELIIYDPSETKLVNGNAYLMDIEGILQIRSVEILKKNFARLWFHERGIQTVVHMRRLQPDCPSPIGRIIGKILSRVDFSQEMDLQNNSSDDDVHPSESRGDKHLSPIETIQELHPQNYANTFPDETS
jgi:hypothetical protein